MGSCIADSKNYSRNKELKVELPPGTCTVPGTWLVLRGICWMGYRNQGLWVWSQGFSATWTLFFSLDLLVAGERLFSTLWGHMLTHGLVVFTTRKEIGSHVHPVANTSVSEVTVLWSIFFWIIIYLLMMVEYRNKWASERQKTLKSVRKLYNDHWVSQWKSDQRQGLRNKKWSSRRERPGNAGA